jgi:competence protein ComEC
MAKHPALYLVLAFGGGIVCQSSLRAPFALVVPAYAVAISCAFLLFTRKNFSANARLISAALLLAVFCAGVLRTALAEKIPSHEASRWADDEREVTLLGEILDAPEPRRDYWRAPILTSALQFDNSAAMPRSGVVLAYGKALQNLAPGDHVMVRGRLRLADEARNPGAFDYRAYLRANEICALFHVSDSTSVWMRRASTYWSLRGFSARTRAWVEKQIAAFARGQARALIKGLVLGQVEEIDAGVMESFARTGLIHILSVSGLHVGFIALLLMLGASLLRLPKRWQWPAVVLALWFYAYLTGMKPPIVRASVMATVILFGGAFERDTSLLNNLGASALLILLWQPLQLFQLGFQLSFAAMFGIAYLYKPLLVCFARILPWRLRLLHWAIQLLAVSFAAQLATLPIVVINYGRVALTAIWGNLVVIPISFVTVATAALACAFAPLSEFAVQAYGVVSEITAAFMIAFTHWLAGLPWSYVEGVRLPPLLLLCYLILLALLVLWRKPVRARVLLAALLALDLHVWNEARQTTPKLRVTFFDVGQGDAALLEFSNGERLLIDTGPRFGESNAGERVVAPYLHRQGIRRLHAVIISHPHADHLGGLPSLLTSIQIDTVYHNGVNSGSELEHRSVRLMDSLRVPYRALREGERLAGFTAAHVAALCAGAAFEAQARDAKLNEASLVIKVVYGKIALLFPGDAERLSEEHLVQHGRALDSDLLKVGHHGSRTSSAENFLRAVTPQWAVISVGRYNRFEHPHKEVLARYEKLGIRTLRTDQTGAVIFETEGRSLKRVR